MTLVSSFSNCQRTPNTGQHPARHQQKMISYSSVRAAAAKAAARAAFTLLTVGLIACGDAAAPRPAEPALRVELSPRTMSLGRGDRVQVIARVLGQGDSVITGRTVTFSSDDADVAVIGSPDNVIGAPGFLIAVGPGSTTIRASVDGVAGTALVSVVIADTTFALSQYNGSTLPVLVAADSILFNGVKEFDEVYAESGTLVLSGLMQLRYRLDVRYSQYHVIRTGGTVQRELRFQSGEFDRGIGTVDANGSLAMLSEFIGPRLEHTAAVQTDGFLVHYRIPGDDSFLDLRYRRQAP